MFLLAYDDKPEEPALLRRAKAEQGDGRGLSSADKSVCLGRNEVVSGNACYSSLSYSSGWQQYVPRMVPQSAVPAGQPPETAGLRWCVCNLWRSSRGSRAYEIYDGGPICPLSLGFFIPAGYRIVIELSQLSGNNDCVASAEFTVFDGSGKQIGRHKQKLEGLPQFEDTENNAQVGKATKANLAPIVGFQVNLVAWADRESTTCLKGAGTITYSAIQGTDLQAPEQSVPCMTSDNLVQTGETSNISYAYLRSAPAPSITQAFQAIPATSMVQESLQIKGAALAPSKARSVGRLPGQVRNESRGVSG
jgi:hypothetical protein